jgi:nucleoside-diphosphate-sugar epimerase
MRVLLVGTESVLSDAIKVRASSHEWTHLPPDALIDDDQVWQAVRGCDAILHLGAFTDGSGDARVDLDLAGRGTYRLLKAAADVGVRRIVIASTLKTFLAYPDDVYITEHWRPLPSDEPDQMLPHLREMVCREFARDCRLGITCLRLGQLVDSDQVGRHAPSLDALDYRDAAQAFHRALERDESQAINWVRRWAIYHITGEHAHPKYLREGARTVGQQPLGYEPEFGFDSADPTTRSGEAMGPADLPPPKTALLIGSNGMIAPNITAYLEQHFALRLADLSPAEDRKDILRVDVTDYAQVLEASRGMDALMNFTVIREDVDGAFSVNVIGAWNVMRAAVELRIKKILHTGPQCIRTHYDHDFDVDDVPRAPGIWQYGLTKMLSYEICRIYARVHGIQTVCYVFNGLHARPEGQCSRSDFPPMTIVYDDLAVACKLALDIPTVPDNYQEFNMLSYEGHGKYNVNKARRVLGFEPTEKWEENYRRSEI